MRKLLKFAGLSLIAIIVGAIVFLLIAPPALIRVASAYSAKIVCSNMFIAGREAGAVLKVDVQAPGHPILKYVRLNVDKEAGSVKASLLGLFGREEAVYRAGFGCTSVNGALAPLAGAVPAAAAKVSGLWPQGEDVAPSQDPKIAAILDDAALTGPGMRAIVVVQNGRIIGERYGEGFSAATPLLGWSMTKTVNAAIIGTLVRDGKLALDQKGFFPDWAKDGRKNISIADLMAMTSGLEFNEDYGDVTDVTQMLFLEGDMAGFAAVKPLKDKIGEVFNYSSGTAVLLSRIWQNALGADAASYPAKALFQPLGMASAVFEADASGTFAGSSYLYATARDWARFGEFMRLGGVWNGQPILPDGFAAMMSEPVPASDTGFGAQYGKGQLWLTGPEGSTPVGQDPNEGFDLPSDMFWLEGHDGQSVAVMPSDGLVVVRMGLTPFKLGYKPQGLAAALLAAVAE